VLCCLRHGGNRDGDDNTCEATDNHPPKIASRDLPGPEQMRLAQPAQHVQDLRFADPDAQHRTRLSSDASRVHRSVTAEEDKAGKGVQAMGLPSNRIIDNQFVVQVLGEQVMASGRSLRTPDA
jgi:hypothetical protein